MLAVTLTWPGPGPGPSAGPPEARGRHPRPEPAALHPPPRVLSLPQGRLLRGLHQPLPGRRNRSGLTRQGEVPGVPVCGPRRLAQEARLHRDLQRVWALSDDGALRVADPAPRWLIVEGA